MTLKSTGGGRDWRDGSVTQALAALPEERNLIPSIHLVAYNFLQLQLYGDLASSSGLWALYILHSGETLTYNKTK